jgi:DNA replication ATP-dependent helicase Dna2
MQNRCGIDMKNLGIISPYRSQVDVIKQSLFTGEVHIANNDDDNNNDDDAKCDVSTVDKFQGRDMDIVIFSFVRSNPEGSVGSLLRDWRRINVAITRAKYKLILIGSLSIFDSIPILKSLADIVKLKKYNISVSPPLMV